MKIDFSNAGFDREFQEKKALVQEALQTLVKGEGEGSDFTGWIKLPRDYDKEEYRRIKEAAKKIQGHSQVLVVIGIGGSYLGARAVVEAFSPIYETGKVQVVYAGNHMSTEVTAQLLDYLKDKDFSINVISKSGTTTEPGLAFRLFRDLLEEKVGKEGLKDRIFVTTDRAKGALKNLADWSGYEEFVVPDDVGGRFTVLTAVGLLPIAVAGIDIDALMAGAHKGMDLYLNEDFDKNPALQYAAMRNVMVDQGKFMEILVAYEPFLKYFQEWWKQLYGESEGKEGKGLFPASVMNTTDLHSLGQWIQEGPRIHFETVLWIKKAGKEVLIPSDADNDDKLNYLAGRDLHEINRNAMLGTLQAHVDGQVPNIYLELEEWTPEVMGQLIYFFEVAVGVSGYMLGVNPFNQPGVEFYKANMFKLLGKPGYEN